MTPEHIENDASGLLAEIEARFSAAAISLRVTRDEKGFTVDLIGLDSGATVWPRYTGPHQTEMIAVVAAEQRWLAEEIGAGTVIGNTYAEKAEERLRRWRQDKP